MKNYMIIDYNDLIEQFIAEQLSGDLYKLKDFCFADLKDVFPYGFCNGNFDCDNTLLTRAICVTIWGGRGNIYEDLNMENIGRGKKYRGDTMNSFRSVLGPYENGQIVQEILALNPSEALKKKINDFFHTYHTIGNFTVLPNIAVGRNITINPYRGMKFGDFFDLFLINYAKADSIQNNIFSQLVAKNQFPKKLSVMAQEMFWQQYFDKQGTPQEVFHEHVSRSSMKKSKNYLAHIEDFIDVSTGIIESRADQMLAKLEKTFNRNFFNRHIGL